MLLDSHCHLDPETWGGDGAVDALVARARDAGVSRMIHIGAGYGRKTFARAVAVAERHDGVWFTAGVHPHDAVHYDAAVEAELQGLSRHPRFVAFGEMGLDFHYDMSPRDVQRAAFRAQIRMARAHDRPIVIHDRESEGETLRILDEEGGFGGRVLYHCYTGDRAHMREIVDRGGFVSIPGIVTFKNAEEMRAVATEVPADRLLVETDSPFLAPVPFRGRKNEPALVRVVAEKVAELRGVSLEALAALTTANALRFYGLEGAGDPVTG